MPEPTNGKGYESAVKNVVAARLAEMEMAKREQEDNEAEESAAKEAADAAEDAKLEEQHKAMGIAPMLTEQLRATLARNLSINRKNKKKFEDAAEQSRQNLISANAGHDKRWAGQCREGWKNMLTAAKQAGLNVKALEVRLAELPPEPPAPAEAAKPSTAPGSAAPAPTPAAAPQPESVPAV